MKRHIATLLMAGALAFPVAGLLSGCGNRAGNGDEAAAYARWEAETHREHREVNQRNKDEQSEYDRWRHDHH
jgi:hypothetical protein